VRTETIYEPLPVYDCIRLLRLHPGDTEHDIECSLVVVDIEASKDSYESISYVWGDPKDTVGVWCNGLRVAITVSLANALRNFRLLSEPRLLWADTVCINQEDDEEKGCQVKRMGLVYSNAKRVLIWLGCDAENMAKDTFALIREVNTHFGESFAKVHDEVSGVKSPMEPYLVHNDGWSGVRKLFEFPWFTRVWTVQEAASSKNGHIYWGSVSIDIVDILELCIWLGIEYDFRDTIQSRFGNIKYLSSTILKVYFHYNTHRRRPWQQSRVGMVDLATRYQDRSFLTVLRAARGLQATDPRDHVYAFLGCPFAKTNEGKTLVEADYTLSIRELSIRLAYVLMEHPKEGPWTLSAIGHVCRAKLLDDDYPSWIPVWHVTEGYRKSIANSRYWFRAGGDRGLFAAARHGEGAITVGGYAFDKVSWISTTIKQLDQADSSLVCSNVTICESHEPLIDTVWNEVYQNAIACGIQVRQDDFVRTLLTGYPDGRSRESTPNEVQRNVVERYRMIVRGVQPKNYPEAVELTADEIAAVNYFRHALREINNTRLFLTEKGRIGLAPRGELIEVGDVCCVIFGASVPFLLTPAKEGRHKLISECYIHGVMGGEGMERFAESDLSDRRIVFD
jgi:hypothetical protein